MRNIDKYLDEILNADESDWSCKAAKLSPYCLPCSDGTVSSVACSRCQQQTAQWLKEEYVEKTLLTQFEYDILAIALHQGYRWIAKDTTSGLQLHVTQPERIYEEWRSRGRTASLDLFSNLFDFVTTLQTKPTDLSYVICNCKIDNRERPNPSSSKQV